MPYTFLISVLDTKYFSPNLFRFQVGLIFLIFLSQLFLKEFNFRGNLNQWKEGGGKTKFIFA